MTLYGLHGTRYLIMNYGGIAMCPLANATLQPRSVKECWALLLRRSQVKQSLMVPDRKLPSPPDAWWCYMRHVDGFKECSAWGPSGMWRVFCLKISLPVSPFSASLMGPQPWDKSVLINKFLLHRKRSATAQYISSIFFAFSLFRQFHLTHETFTSESKMTNFLHILRMH